jgi:hypothetical protein
MASIMFNTFEPSALVFSDMKRNASGGKTVYIKRGGSAALFELPEMRAPFGLSSYTDQKTNKTTFSVDLSMENPDVANFFSNVEKVVLEKVISHCEEYLGKTYSREVIQSALFKSCVRESKEPGKYPPTLKLKVLVGNDGSFVPRCYDHNRQSIKLDEIQKGQRVKSIVDINQVWIVDNKFGITVRLMQLMTFPLNSLPECAFSEDDDGVEEE